MGHDLCIEENVRVCPCFFVTSPQSLGFLLSVGFFIPSRRSDGVSSESPARGTVYGCTTER